MLPVKMSVCAYPQVRIYEDFDKMSAKEVYYNEAGKKITVKLLHFPEVPPEEINKISFEEEEKQQMEIINGNKPMPLVAPIPPKRKQKREEKEKQKEEEELQDNDEEDDDPEEEEIAVDDTEADEDKEADEADKDKKDIAPQPKKALRKKSSGNLNHARKVSMAFAQAHGMSIAATSGAVPKTPPPTPTIMIPPKSLIDNKETIAQIRKNSLLNRRSPSPHGLNAGLSPGYAQYSKSLLEVPLPRDYGYASSDDLSSEWDSDVPSTNNQQKKVGFFLPKKTGSSRVIKINSSFK